MLAGLCCKIPEDLQPEFCHLRQAWLRRASFLQKQWWEPQTRTGIPWEAKFVAPESFENVI
jgi:hypothetical protein